MKRKRLHLLFFGPPGCGKSTQADLLSKKFGAHLVHSGVAFRQELEEGSALGLLAEPYVEASVFAPDEVAHAILKKRLKPILKDEHFILDGYPRNVEQGAALEKMVPMTLAVQLKMRETESLTRLSLRRICVACHTIHGPRTHGDAETKCGTCGKIMKPRQEDSEEMVRRRWALYRFMTEPLASYYRQRGILLAVNAEQPSRSLFDELVRKMGKLGFMTGQTR